MSDSKNPKPLPPDDFSATTPNFKVPKSDSPKISPEPSSDWEKTNYNYSAKELGVDDWNKTAFNTPKTPSNPHQPPARDAEWGMTQANINLPTNQTNQYEQPNDDYGAKRADYGATSVGITLPKNEPPQYQEPPSEKKPEEQTEKKKSGGLSWVWTSLGLLGMFLFAVFVLLGVYFFFLNKKGFEVTVKGVPPRSDVLVNGSNWGVTSFEENQGVIRLQLLRAGETKKIEIKNPSFNCEPIPITLEEAKDGKVVPKGARCAASGNTGNNTGNNNNNTGNNTGTAPQECLEIKKGDYAKAAKCAYDELDKLEKAEKAGTMFTVEQLLYAMNLYIINFDKNKAIIKPNDMTFIAKASGFMKKLPATTVIEVGGHTDTDGTDVRNQPLSEERATAVKNALVQFGIPETLLKTKGYGSKVPKESNDTEDGKFRNRRIEYTIAK